MGTEKDYYVVEGSAPAAEDGVDRGAAFEPRGTGINQFAYWVSTSPEGPWEPLDDCEPVDLEQARSFKVAFTGCLDREIITNPFYFKKERHYLRAQIARITQTCKLMPANVYRLKEDDPTDVEENIPEDGDNPVAPVPTTDQMVHLSAWVHFG
jgi:radial spoke head protein 4/6